MTTHVRSYNYWWVQEYDDYRGIKKNGDKFDKKFIEMTTHIRIIVTWG